MIGQAPSCQFCLPEPVLLHSGYKKVQHCLSETTAQLSDYQTSLFIMESLLSKMGPFRALFPGSAHRQEGIDVLAAGSVQVSTQLPQHKTSVAASATLTEDSSKTAAIPCLNPLPLPAPHSGVPSPLRFLWFNKKKEFEQVSPVGKGHSSSIHDNLTEEPHATDCVPPYELQPPQEMKHWIFRLIDFKMLWPSSKAASKLSLVTEPVTTVLSRPPDSPDDIDKTCNISSCGLDSNCSCDCESAECMEVPYEPVLHNRESFSQFLQEASLSDLKVVSQMSFLCDLAYMIPDIQPAQLLKLHSLMFVTSSLDKKAEAAARLKESDKTEKACSLDNTMDDIAVGCSRLETSIEMKSGFSLPSDMGAVHSNTVDKGNGEAVTVIREVTGMNENSRVEGSCYFHEESQCDFEESTMSVGPLTAVVVAEEETKRAVAQDCHLSHNCPCEWYICDDQSTHTRILVVQGSESLASWQANLFFEPSKFEGLDVLVHRGIYDAANALYEQVFPEILAHFTAHGPLARFRFTGHSLGGSLATLLALMFQIRHILPSSAILPVVTFGSPCITCGGDRLLRRMNLHPSFIQSVTMHRDVVPRAFACDYPDHVAQVLKRLNKRFQNHPCLNNQKLLYTPMGQLWILQPDESVAPTHPLLPRGHGLYLLKHPISGQSTENATQLRAAQRAFLNMPHPLEILADPRAYGSEGAISRDHDPRSYTKATHLALTHEVKRLRHLQREQRRWSWRFLVLGEAMQTGIKGCISVDKATPSVAAISAISKSSLVFKQTMNSALANQIGFSSSTISIWSSHKAAIGRYSRLIASKHVQMGLLIIVTTRMLVLQCLSTLFVWI